jgi:hypothetical protein
VTGEVIDQEIQIIGKPIDSRETFNRQTTDITETGYRQTDRPKEDRWQANKYIYSRVTGEMWTCRPKETGDRGTQIQERQVAVEHRIKRDRWPLNAGSRETGDRWTQDQERDRGQLNTDSRETGDSWTQIQERQGTVEHRIQRERWQLNTDSRETGDSWTQIQERQATVEHGLKRDMWHLNTDTRETDDMSINILKRDRWKLNV